MSKLIDKYRPGTFIVLHICLAVLGQLFIIISLKFQIFFCMFLGRFLLNSALTPILMANGKIMSNLFDKKKLATANSLCLTINLMGNLSNLRFSGIITQNYGFMISVYFGFFLLAFSCFLSIFVFNLETKFQNQQKQNQEQEIQNNNNNQWSHFLKNMPLPFVFFGICIGILNLIGNIIEIIGPSYLSQNYNFSPEESGKIISIIPIITITMPIFSQIIDKFGNPLLLLIPASFLGFFSSYFLTIGYPNFNMILFGFSFTLRWVAVFPGIEELVNKNDSAKAFGSIRVFRDILGVIVSFLNGILYDNYKSYYPSLILATFLQIISFFSIIMAILLIKKQNNNQNNFLNFCEENYEENYEEQVSKLDKSILEIKKIQQEIFVIDITSSIYTQESFQQNKTF